NELDAYYTAFTVPDFVALILIFGAISAAIIPIFSSYLVKSKDEAFEYASNLFNIFFAGMVAVCLVLIIFAPFFISLIAPGFSGVKRLDTIMLMRIMFLSPIILGMSNIITGILQVFHRFLVTALAPIMYNLGIIIGILFFVPRIGLTGLAWGVVLGGLLHVLIQIPALLYSGFSYKKVFNLRHSGVVKTFKLMIPRSLGLGAGQLNVIATTAIASTLATGSVAVFNLANNLSSMLVNAIAVSLSTAIFPAMSLAISQHDTNGFNRKFSRAFLQILFLTIPMSVMIFLLRAQIVRIILGTGKFSWMDTRLTAACLGIFAIGLYGQGLIFMLSKTFYAAHNTKIPAIISAATVAFNIGISLLFVWTLNRYHPLLIFVQWLLRLEGISNITVVALAFAYAITGILESSLLLFFLYRTFKVFRMRLVGLAMVKILLASAVMGIVVVVLRQVI